MAQPAPSVHLPGPPALLLLSPLRHLSATPSSTAGATGHGLHGDQERGDRWWPAVTTALTLGPSVLRAAFPNSSLLQHPAIAKGPFPWSADNPQLGGEALGEKKGGPSTSLRLDYNSWVGDMCWGPQKGGAGGPQEDLPRAHLSGSPQGDSGAFPLL